MAHTTTTRKDLYQEVTDRIIAQLEEGLIPWHKPWTGTQSGAVSGTTGKPYSLLNQLLLQKPGKWYTYKQAQSLGGQVRKGEKGSMVVFWKPVIVTEETKDGEKKQKKVPMLRNYVVFHADQIDNLPESETAEEPRFIPNPDEAAESIITEYLTRESIHLEQAASNEAFYSPSFDKIHLPLMEQFPDTAEYYSTAFHEMTHSTGHKSRLNRLESTAHFGNEEYSKEELVAEIGAASLLNHCGLETPKTFKNSAAYIQSWLQALKNDKKMIVSAASKASRAVDFILTGAIPEAF